MNVYLKASDDRNLVNLEANTGIYYVNKINTLKTFSFGEGELHSDCKQANKSLINYLAKRDDSESLNVTLINL